MDAEVGEANEGLRFLPPPGYFPHTNSRKKKAKLCVDWEHKLGKPVNPRLSFPTMGKCTKSGPRGAMYCNRGQQAWEFVGRPTARGLWVHWKLEMAECATAAVEFNTTNFLNQQNVVFRRMGK